MKKDFSCYHLGEHAEDGHITTRKNRDGFPGIPSLPYCECSKSIARFYLLELTHSQRKNSGNFWNGRHEAYYLREVTSEAVNILRFVLSAGIGEARHGHHHAYPENCGEYNINKRLSKKFLEQIFVQIGWRGIPRHRESVYKTYIPEDIFWGMFKLVHDFYSLDWENSYGGEAWRKGIELAMKTYKAVCLGDFPKICIWLDTLINHCHNGGVLLNKFNCLGYMIQDLLNNKQEGNIGYLEKIIIGKSTPSTYLRSQKCIQCPNLIPLAPLE